MPMNPNFLCCIGAELKNSKQQTTRMAQVYLYRAFEDDTLSDMLSAGFFDEAIGILRQDDLLLLYSPNETVAKWAYARVSNVDRDGITVERIGLEAAAISVNTEGYSNISGDNLQEIINSIDSEFSKYVKLDGTSIMTGPLKMRAGSMQGAVAAYWDGVGFFKLNSNDSVTLLASMEATDGLCPATNNTYNIGKTNYKWKDAHIARVITAVINNGGDLGVPANTTGTLATKADVDLAANSGRMITDQGVWFAKMYAATVPPAADDGTNYADFSQTDGDGNPIIVIYERQSGAWVQSQTITPPANYDGYVPVTKKIWDIVEQTGQNGGRILWNHQSKEFTPYPNVISFEDIEITGESTVDMPLNPVPQQITNKDYVDGAVAASAATKANIDMDNLTDTGKNIANWSSNVTNCLTEIPQDIKLELNAGVLTLKAGSKVYVPNGAGTFNTVTIANDLTATSTSNEQNLVFFFNGSLGSMPIKQCFSGSSAPSAYQYMFWYDTTNNLVKFTSDSGSTWTANSNSLSLGLVTASSIEITSIDQVFNGFGYIGSTVFALPGVKGLIPNGRNSDGTLKNTSFTTNEVHTATFSGTANYTTLALSATGWIGESNNYSYAEDINYNIFGGDRSDIQNVMYFGSCSLSSGKISNFSAKTVFHAVDYSDTEYIAHQAMPSNRYVDLTLGASGTTYTMPADGYIRVSKSATAAGQWLSVSNNSVSFNLSAGGPGNELRITIPVRKDSTTSISYSLDGTTSGLRFIYANGAA